MPFPASDPTLHPSPRCAMRGPTERFAYVALAATTAGEGDALAVLDAAPSSSQAGAQIGEVRVDEAADGLQHLGWNTGGASLAPWPPGPASTRRYLVAPGTRSSRVVVFDVGETPHAPTVAGVVPAQEICRRAGYSRPTIARAGPGGIYVNALAGSQGTGPGGLFVIDPATFDVRGRWEIDRGPQQLAADFGWHLGYDTVVTGGWGPAALIDGGFNPDALRAGAYGHHLHVWSISRRRHLQALDLGVDHQMVTSVRPAHDPTRAYGFAVTACSRKDWSSSVWLWHRAPHDAEGLSCRRILDIPAEPAAPTDLPDVLQPAGRVPALACALALSLDDRSLYVSCWGTGRLLRYDVSDPFRPVRTGEIRLGGTHGRKTSGVSRARPCGGPHAVTVSRDGRRLWVTSALHPAWHRQWCGDRVDGWCARLDADPDGGLALRADGVRRWPGRLAGEVRLDGGDAASETFCYA